MGTLSNLIDRTLGLLNADNTNRPKLGTLAFLSFLSGTTVDVMQVSAADGTGSHIGPAVIEIGTSLIFATNYDSNSMGVTVPAWGNGYGGSTPISTSPVGSMVTINPIWYRHNIGLLLIDAINQMYPQLYGVKMPSTPITSSNSSERYELPSDAEQVLKVDIEGYGPISPRRQFKRWGFEYLNADSKKYLILPQGMPSGRPILVKYRTKPVLPTSPADTAWTWATSLLPSSAEDLPILKVASTLVMSNELAKMQTFSAEQSDRSRFVTSGIAASASRRWDEMYEKRLGTEQQKLSNLYGVRPHLTVSGG